MTGLNRYLESSQHAAGPGAGGAARPRTHRGCGGERQPAAGCYSPGMPR